MNAEFMLLAIYNKPTLTLEEVCEVVGVSKETAYVQRSNGTFAIPMTGKPLRADVRDVAKYLDDIRQTAQQEHKQLKAA
jgi:predicted DNA-binding transcriptional regulator AlpA